MWTTRTSERNGNPVSTSGVNAIDHIGLLVHDIDAVLPWFTGHLGFRVISDEPTPASGGARLVYLDAGNIVLQVLSPTTSEGPLAEHLRIHGEGLHHICLSVADIDQAIAVLAPAANLTPVVGGGGLRTAMLPQRPGGMITELVEGTPHAPGSADSSRYREN